MPAAADFPSGGGGQCRNIPRGEYLNMSSSDNPSKPGPRLVTPDTDVAIPKPPEEFSLERFRSKRDPSIGSVETLLTALPHHPIAQAKDFVRLHPDPAYWSPELCFVSVPVKGMK